MNQKKIIPAVRTDNITYAVRDIVVLANEVAKSGKEMLYLNIGDPNIYDFEPPEHLVKATYDAMLKNYNGYAPSSGINEAIESIEREAEKKAKFEKTRKEMDKLMQEIKVKKDLIM